MKNTLLIPGLPPHWGSGGYATGTDTKQHKRNIQNLLPEECPAKWENEWTHCVKLMTCFTVLLTFSSNQLDIPLAVDKRQ